MDATATKSMLIIFRFNTLAFFAALLPWVGALSNQISQRGLLPKVFVDVLIAGGFMFLLLMLIFILSIFIDDRNPSRQIIPVLLAMTFTSFLSAVLALATYLFI